MKISSIKKTLLFFCFFIATYSLQVIAMEEETTHLFFLEQDDSHTYLEEYLAIFAHGLGGAAAQKINYQNFIGCPITAKNGPEWDHIIYGHNSGQQQSHLAQDADIAVIVKQIRENTHNNLILFGVSKGAATIINTIGQLAFHHENTLLNNIKAVLLDSPFASPEKVAANIVRKNTTSLFTSLFGSRVGSTLGNSLGSSVESCACRPLVTRIEKKLYKNYNPNGITPIKAITTQWETVDKNLVIIFVHSTEDELIAIDDSRLLYCELKNRGFNNLYLIEASQGEHAYVFCGPEKKHIKQNLCLIYQVHSLPLPPLTHDELNYLDNLSTAEIAAALLQMQPSIEEILERLHPYRQNWLCFS